MTATSPYHATNPLDEHNQKLLDHAHPQAWANPQPAENYNLVVIGAGTAGLVTAAGSAGLGAKVALIERELMGGDCLNVGCVPSKAIIRSARAVHDARRAGDFGVRIEGDITVDFPAVMERMRKLRAGISHVDSAKRFSDLGVDVFLGQAKFTGSNTVEVGDQTLKFSRAVLATGARAMPLPIDGLEEAGYLTNETIFSLTELPKRLAVIGGGPIGVEMAQAFARFGSQVFLLSNRHQFLGKEDRDAAEVVRASMERDGVDFTHGDKITAVRAEGEVKTITFENGSELSVDAILIGVGRKPNVEGLDLERVGVEYDPIKGVQVDDHLRTTNPNIYAAGDIATGLKFTHMADFMARIVIRNALFFGRSKVSDLTVPWCTYCDPEVAHVGLNEQTAKDKGIETDTIRVNLDDVDRAILESADEGFLKVLVRKGKGQILGATLVAEHAGDMISEIAVAMHAGAGLGDIANVIHPYPTQADVIRKAGDAYNRTKLTPTVAKVFDTLLRWRR